jgi:hypothetical protein
MRWLPDDTPDDWLTPWKAVLAGSPQFLDALAKTPGKRRAHALALLGAVQDGARFRLLAHAVNASLPDIMPWFLGYSQQFASSSQAAYQVARNLNLAFVSVMKPDEAEGFRLRLAVAACVVPAALPAERKAISGDLDELAVCASLRRQDAEVRRFLSAE